MLFEPYARFHIFIWVWLTEWPTVTYWKIAARLAYDMFSKYKYLIVNYSFSHLGVWSGDFSVIALLPDRCLLVPF